MWIIVILTLAGIYLIGFALVGWIAWRDCSDYSNNKRLTHAIFYGAIWPFIVIEGLSVDEEEDSDYDCY